jgi:hypothetical protein
MAHASKAVLNMKFDEKELDEEADKDSILRELDMQSAAS